MDIPLARMDRETCSCNLATAFGPHIVPQTHGWRGSLFFLMSDDDLPNILEAVRQSERRITKRLEALETKVQELGEKISPETLAEAFYEMPIPG